MNSNLTYIFMTAVAVLIIVAKYRDRHTYHRRSPDAGWCSDNDYWKKKENGNKLTHKFETN